MADRRTVESTPEASAHREERPGSDRDQRYARVLLDHLDRDCERFDRSRDWGPIVLWMAEEVRRQAQSLALPRETARRMCDRASMAQAKVLRASA
jgi:hypothetical protein